jgi:hypothetical protein
MANDPPKRPSTVVSEKLRDPKVLEQMREIIEIGLARGEVTQEEHDNMIGVVERIERKIAEGKGSA